MKKDFSTNILFLIGINLLIKPLYIFWIDLKVQNTVGPEIYGVFFALFNFTFIFHIINDLGIQNYNNRLIAQYRVMVNRFLPQVLGLKFVLAIIFLIVIFIASRVAGYGAQYDYLIFLVGINQILVGVLFYLRTNISGLGLYRTDSIVSALDKLLMIIFCSILLYLPFFADRFQIEWFVLAQSIAYSISILVAFALIFPHLDHFKLKFQPRFWWLIIRESSPYALVLFLMILYTRVDGVMIERLLEDGKYQAGVYAAGYRLLDALNLIGFLFSGLLLPMFARSLKKGESIELLLGLSFRLIWAGAITAAFSTYFFQEEIMTFLYTGADAYWGEVMGYLLFTFVAVSGTYIWGSLLTANGSLREMNTFLVIGVVANVLLNILLIPTYKALGAALATVITQSITLLAQVLLAKKIFRLPFRMTYLLQILGFVIVVASLTYVSYYHLPFIWYVNFFVNISLCLLAALALRMIHPKMLTTFLKQE